MKVSSFLKRAAAVAVGVAAVFAAGGARAADAKQLEYIATSGTQWISTGVAGNTVYGLRAGIAVTKLKSSWQSLIGGTLDNFTLGTKDSSVSACYLRFRGAEKYNNSAAVISTSSCTDIAITNGVFTINGVTKATGLSGSLDTTATSIAICNNGAGSRPSNMNVYYFQLFDADGELIADLVPARMEDGTVGLYDIKRMQLFANSGSGAFTEGPDVGPLPLDYVTVTGSPSNFGTPNPAYGICADLMVGEEKTFTCPAVYTNDAENVAATCCGWTFALTNGTETSGSGLSNTITYGAEMLGATLTWNWDVEYKVTSVDGVTVSSNWVAKGSVVTLTATPPAGMAVFKWTDTLSGNVYEGNPLNVKVTAPMNLEPAYGEVRYVATDGHDDTGDGSSGSPYKSISKALSVVDPIGFVIVKSGNYSMDAQLSVTNEIIICGETGKPADILLTRSGTGRHFVLNNARSRISGFTLKGGIGTGGGSVYINPSGGTVSNCVFTANRVSNWGGNGGAISINSSAGLVTHCCFTNNIGDLVSYKVCGGHAAYIGSGTLRNCFFKNNGTRTLGFDGGGIVFMTGGTVESCTFVNNADAYCAGIRAKGGGAARNCVFYGADCPSATSELMKIMYDASQSNRFSYCCGPVQINDGGTCVASADPFVDSAHGDWNPAGVIVDKGIECDWMADAGDLAGNPRLSGTAPDIGCYERDQSVFSASVETKATSGLAPFTVTFTVTAYGAGDQGVTCHWDWDGNGTWDDTSDGTTNHVYKTGSYSTKVKVVDNATKQEYEPDAPFSLVSVPKTIYVDVHSADPKSPYADKGHAATNLADAYAVAIDGCEIVVVKGSYSCPSVIEVLKNVSFRSETGDPADVLLTRSGTGRHFYFNNAGAKISGFTLKGGVGEGGGSVYISSLGGTVSNCAFTANRVSNWGGNGGAISINSSAGLVTHCCFTNNIGDLVSYKVCGGHAAYIGSGTLRNCFFKNNGTRTLGFDGGGIVFMTGGTVESCTFVNNADAYCAGIRAKGGGAARNCVFYGADCPSATSELMKIMYDASQSNRFTYCCGPVQINDGGTCVPSADPFADSAHGDWTPAAVIVDKGVKSDWMEGALDLAGNPRISGDDPDIGCYEKDQSQFGASVETSATSGLNPFTVTFSVTTYGAGEEGVTCHWDWDGNGTWDDTSDGTTNHVYETGSYSTKVKVVDNATKQEYEPDAPFSLVSVPKTLYVDVHSDDPKIPYADKSHAAANLADAYVVAIDGCEIVVAAGPYTCPSVIEVTRDVKFRGETGDPADVLLTRSGTGRHFVLNNANAKISGFTLKGGVGEGGGAIYINSFGGTVSNCVFTANRVSSWNGTGGAISINSSAGLVTHSCFTNNIGDLVSYKLCGGHAVTISSGTLRNCFFARNGTRTLGMVSGGGGTVYMTGGTTESCTFVTNADAYCAGVCAAGGSVRNCLFYGADCPSATTELMKIMNSSSYSNRFTYCCAPVPINDGGTCVATDDPQFKKPEQGDYRLKSTSPAVGKGGVSPWMTGATDLLGKPRLVGRYPDIGCYECQSAGFTLIVR